MKYLGKWRELEQTILNEVIQAQKYKHGGDFSSVIWLNIFSGFFNKNSFPSCNPIVLRFDLFIVSQISWMFCIENYLMVNQYTHLTNVSIYFIVFSITYILHSITCILFLKFASVVPAWIPNFFISRFPCLCFLYFIYFLWVPAETCCHGCYCLLLCWHLGILVLGDYR